MANLYDLKKFDLNLLVIFECIYQHLSISKAAETLYITPSAVSQSLQRLRNQLNDPLFIRSCKIEKFRSPGNLFRDILARSAIPYGNSKPQGWECLVCKFYTSLKVFNIQISLYLKRRADIIHRQAWMCRFQVPDILLAI